MSTMNISLPSALKDLVDEQVEARGFGTVSEYIRDLVRKDLDRRRLRGLLLEGAESEVLGPMDEAWLDTLRERARGTSSS